MRLIDADNALELFRAEYQNTESLIKQGEKQLDSLAEGYTEAAAIIKHISLTVDAVPVSELLNLRDELYEKDQITMRGLEKLNRLIAAYSSQLKQQEHPIESTLLTQEERWLKTV